MREKPRRAYRAAVAVVLVTAGLGVTALLWPRPADQSRTAAVAPPTAPAPAAPVVARKDAAPADLRPDFAAPLPLAPPETAPPPAAPAKDEAKPAGKRKKKPQIRMEDL